MLSSLVEIDTRTTDQAGKPIGAAPRGRAPRGVELNGINVIAEVERRGGASSLFWPWFASNISVLGVSYGAFILGFGISFWQAVFAGVVGVVVSFAFCGVIALAGKRGSAPTMVLSRAAFGLRGNRVPAGLSWLLTVGWETVLVVLATLATDTVLTRLGWGGGTGGKVVALFVVSAVIVLGGIAGFDVVMRIQVVITVVTAFLTVAFIILVAGHIHWHSVAAVRGGSAQHVIGALVFVMTGFGLGWVNAAADYSRYLPRRTPARGVFGWTTFGAAIGPAVLLTFGLLLAGSSSTLQMSIGNDPVGALTSILPTWFLVPFALAAVCGLIGGAVLDIYSSGLALLSAGLRIPRYAAAGVDGVIMVAATIYVVFFTTDFLSQFQGFLITLGVPVAAWCGVMLADVALRRRDYAEAELFDRHGRYGDVRAVPLFLMAVGTVIGWGLVTNTFASWLKWQGYLLAPFALGGKNGEWASAELGVVAALVIGLIGTLLTSPRRIRAQEAAAVGVSVS
jgi:NCS1 family nucleobase:cation symporter-1